MLFLPNVIPAKSILDLAEESGLDSVPLIDLFETWIERNFRDEYYAEKDLQFMLLWSGFSEKLYSDWLKSIAMVILFDDRFVINEDYHLVYIDSDPKFMELRKNNYHTPTESKLLHGS